MLFASSSPEDCVRFVETLTSSLIFMTPHHGKSPNQFASKNEDPVTGRRSAERLQFSRCCRLPFDSTQASFESRSEMIRGWTLRTERSTFCGDQSDLFRRGWHALLSHQDGRR